MINTVPKHRIRLAIAVLGMVLPLCGAWADDSGAAQPNASPPPSTTAAPAAPPAASAAPARELGISGLCAPPAAEDASLCAALTKSPTPANLDKAAQRLDTLGRYGDAAAVAQQSVDKLRAANADGVVLIQHLSDLSMLLREQGRYADSAAAAAAALALPRVTGKDGDLAQSSALLADGWIARAQGKYPHADEQLRAALALREAAAGPDAAVTADVLDPLAELTGTAGSLTESDKLAHRALAIREKTGGKTTPAYARSAANVALIARALSHLDEATALIQAALDIDQKTYGPNHPLVADDLNTAGLIDRSLGKMGDAEAAITRALQIRVATLGPSHPDVATSAANLALIYQRTNRMDQAESLYRKVIQIRVAALGPEHPDVGSALNNLAGLMRMQNRLSEAEQYYRRAAEINVAALGPDHIDVALGLANMAAVHKVQGRYALAEAELRRALAIREKALPPEHPDIAATLGTLGEVYASEGRAKDAEAAYLRALDIQQKALGPDHPDVATTLNNLAALYRASSRLPEAEDLYKRSLAIYQKTLPAGHPAIANSLSNLAELYLAENKLDDAVKLQRAALDIREKALGPNHPDVATSLNNLALALRNQGKFAEAKPLLLRAIQIRTDAYGPDHPDVANAYNSLAELLTAEGHPKEGLDAIRKATAIFRERAGRGEEANSAAADAERKLARYLYENHINFEEAALHSSHESVAETFEIAQLAQGTSVGAVIAKMAARFAAGTDALGQLVRQRQDAVQLDRKLDASLIKAATLPAAARDLAAEDATRNQRKDLRVQIRAFDVKLHDSFPQYAAAVSTDPVPLEAAQKLLRPEEAMVSFLVADTATYIWVLRKNSARLYNRPVSRTQLVEVVRELRRGLDPSQIRPDSGGKLPIFNTKLSYALYQDLIEPIRTQLKGATRLLIINDGPLQSLPAHVLVMSPFDSSTISDTGDYRKVDWLVRHYAIDVIPSVGAIRALRTFTHGSAAPLPFLGIGDPRLGRPRLRSKIADTTAAIEGGAPGADGESDMVDLNLVNTLSPLPETADELKAMATTLGASLDQVYTGIDATPERIRQLPLSDFRVVAFATHGLMAGELKGLKEPALVLTSTPQTPTGPDDGLLRASQIAQLHFNADWVVLSACNTAASDGSAGAEGLSGLAKAFFYAGTRAMLVSNWPVNSGASVQLTTTSVKSVTADPKIGKSEALRRSIVKLMDKGNPFYAHPMMWAPFVVVGEGGPER